MNYARWVPIHIRDMKSLPESIRREFQDHGHWVLLKTGNRFSSIPLDQVHERENKMVEGSGGADFCGLQVATNKQYNMVPLTGWSP